METTFVALLLYFCCTFVEVTLKKLELRNTHGKSNEKIGSYPQSLHVSSFWLHEDIDQKIKKRTCQSILKGNTRRQLVDMKSG